MECTAIFDTIDALQETYISFWEDVCNIESPTDDKAGVDAVGKYFAAAAKEFGWLDSLQEAAKRMAAVACCI